MATSTETNVLSSIENVQKSRASELDSNLHKLENVLKSGNFKRLPVTGDGNCLFYAVAYFLLCRRQHECVQQLLLKFDCMPDNTQPVKHLTAKLREAVVQEWLGENTLYYQSFLTHQQLQVEVHRFLRDGEFAGDIGDLVLPAVVNVLALPMTVFTSAQNMAVITLLPTTSVAVETEPIYLSYIHDGPGHYDAVLRDEQENVEPQVDSRVTEGKCTCGKKSTKGISCAFSLNHYSTRCPCFKANRACTPDCRCRRCSNPNGVRTIAESNKTGHKRIRHRYDFQNYELKERKTAKFMQEIGEDVT